MVGWMEKLLLGGEQVGRVVQIVQRVEEVHLPGKEAPRVLISVTKKLH